MEPFSFHPFYLKFAMQFIFYVSANEGYYLKIYISGSYRIFPFVNIIGFTYLNITINIT